jgi:hypothetical protein
MTGTALPPWAVDLIRDGVKAGSGQAVHTATNSLCLSAIVNGVPYADLAAMIFAPGAKLGVQLCVRNGKLLSLPEGHKRLRGIWTNAAKWKAHQADHVNAAEVTRRAKAMRELAECGACDRFTDTERAVLAYAARQALDKGMARVALPHRAVAAAAGITRHAAARTLADLSDRGVLPVHTRGRGCVGCAATLYTLPVSHKTASQHQDHQRSAIRQHDDQNSAIGRSPVRGKQVSGERVTIEVEIRAGETLDGALRRALGERVPVVVEAAGPLPGNVTSLGSRRRQRADRERPL